MVATLPRIKIEVQSLPEEALRESLNQIVATYGENWEQDADTLHEILYGGEHQCGLQLRRPYGMESKMTTYRITYYRPYLPAPERFEAQRTIVIAKDEAEVRDIYKECKITFIEEVIPAPAEAYAVEFLTDSEDPRSEDEQAWDEFVAETQATRESDYPR